MDKTGWTKVKLGDIAELKNGYSFKSSDYDIDKNGTYKIVTIKNVTGEQFISEDNYETVSFLPTNIRNHQILKKGDILISMTGNVGRVSLVRGDNYLLNQRVGLIQIKNKNIVSELYLNQVLSGHDFESTMISRGHGAAQPNIGKDDIESYELYLPPMEIQLQIAKLLTTIDNIIQSKSDESIKYQNMKTQIMNDIFASGEREYNWDKIKLGDICEKIQDGNYGKDYPKANELLDSGIPLINGAAVHGHIIVSELKYISEEMNNRLKKARIYTGDVLFLNRGSIGDTAIVTKEYDNCNIGPQVTLLRPNRSVISTEFLLYLLHSPEIVKLSDSAGGSTIKFLSVNKIRDVEVYLPTMEIQLMIANLLTMYDDVIETVNKEKEDYEKIKTQMMNMIFA